MPWPQKEQAIKFSLFTEKNLNFQYTYINYVLGGMCFSRPVLKMKVNKAMFINPFSIRYF